MSMGEAQLTLWSEIEQAVSGKKKALDIEAKTANSAETTDSIDSIADKPKNKGGRPKGSKVKTTNTAEDMLSELEDKSGVPDKSFPLEVQLTKEERTEKTPKTIEEKTEELWRVYQKIRHFFKTEDSKEDQERIFY